MKEVVDARAVTFYLISEYAFEDDVKYPYSNMYKRFGF